MERNARLDAGGSGSIPENSSIRYAMKHLEAVAAIFAIIGVIGVAYCLGNFDGKLQGTHQAYKEVEQKGYGKVVLVEKDICAGLWYTDPTIEWAK
jgi:hypothetical protein